MTLFYWNEYFTFHKNKFETNKINSSSSESAKDFSIDKIKEIENISFDYSPSKELKNKIVENIDNAEEYIYLEIYMFTEKDIKNAIKRAFDRWIEIKIILEKDPYMAYSINDKFYNELKKKWINVIWSNDKNYSLNHSKILIIDWLSTISTWNFTYSTFTKNRDLFLFIDDDEINRKLIENFNNDFEWIKKSIYHENLILSPLYSRDKIQKLLQSAEKDIKIYIQYFNDDEVRNLLIKIKKEKNLNITAIIPKTAAEDEETKELIKSWINIKIIPKYKMHSKAILIDNNVLFIWSVNFSSYSFDKNREIWILLKNKTIINQFLKLFNNDLNN